MTSRPIPTRGGTRAPFMKPDPATAALIESLRPKFEELCAGPPPGSGKSATRLDGTSRRGTKHIPRQLVPRANGRGGCGGGSDD